MGKKRIVPKKKKSEPVIRPRTPFDSPVRMGLSSAFLANLLIFSVILIPVILVPVNYNLYYLSLQEDQVVEWITFWAFFGASAYFLTAAFRQHKVTSTIPWFLALVSGFCLFVAMEEISWAQRILGYRPSEYFLARNYQQEVNIHNVFSQNLRILALKGTILGYGVFAKLLLPVF